MKSFFVILSGIVAGVYLVNPTFGFFEILPDNLPIVGNIDEAAATAILLGALTYFGIDVSNFFGKRANKK